MSDDVKPTPQRIVPVPEMKPAPAWPEFVQFGNEKTIGPRIPLDRERAEAIRRKNPKAFDGIEQAKRVFLTSVFMRGIRNYETERRYVTPEQCNGLLWCCIEFGLPPHVKYYMEHLAELSQLEKEAWEQRTGTQGENEYKNDFL